MTLQVSISHKWHAFTAECQDAYGREQKHYTIEVKHNKEGKLLA